MTGRSSAAGADMKKYSIFQKNRSSGNMTWYGRISEDVGVPHDVF